jgi:hypothetical protein
MVVSSDRPGADVTISRRGGSQTSTRTSPSQPLVNRACTVPPRPRTPSTTAIHRASRSGSVTAAQRSSGCVG